MATEKPKNYIKIFIIFFILFFLISFALAVAIKTRPRQVDTLPTGSFVSRLLQRTAYRKDGTPYTYYVINTTNNTKEDYFACKKILTAKGTSNQYFGFLTTYTEKNCRPVASGKTQYDCLMANWYHRFRFQDAALTFRKLAIGSNYDVSVSSFFAEISPPAQSFSTSNQLNDIYSVTLNCNTSSGNPITHTQQFDI